MLFLKCLNVFFLIASAWLWFFILEPKIKKWAFSPFVLLMFNPYLLYFKNIIYSDISLLFFSSCFFYFIDKFSKKNLITWRHFLVLGMLLLMATMVRSQGALLVVLALPLYKKYKLKPFILLLIPSFVYFLLIRPLCFPNSGYSYFSYLQNLFPSLINNLGYYLKEMDRLLYFRLHEHLLIQVCYWIAMGALVIGVIKSWGKTHSYMLFLFANLFVLLLWPFQEGPRFIVFLLPVMFLYLTSGIQFCIQKTKVAFIIPLLIVIAYSKEIRASVVYNKYTLDSIPKASQEQLFSYVKENKEEAYVFYRPRVLYYHTKAKAKRIVQMKQLNLEHFFYVHLIKKRGGQLPLRELNEAGYVLKKVSGSNYFEIFDVKHGMK